jgi:hypothetical protein
MLGVILFAFGWLVVGIFRLGEELFSWPVGLLAALLVATRVPYLNFAIRGYVDFAAMAFIVWAGLLEARRPRRGWPVLVLLALLAAAAPFIWGFSDLAITGDFLWSLNGTSDLAHQLGRQTGLRHAPVGARRLGEILRLPELLASVIGFIAGWRVFGRRMAVPTAIALLNGVAWIVFAIAGLSLLGRYLFLLGTMLALFAAVAALGWTALERSHPWRRAWSIGGSAIVALLVLFFAVQQVDRLTSLRTDIGNRDRIQANLHGLATRAPVEALVRGCRPTFVPNHRPVPLIAYWDDIRPASIVTRQPGAAASRGTMFFPANAEVEKLSILDPHEPTVIQLRVPPGWREAARNRSWVLYAGPACQRP